MSNDNEIFIFNGVIIFRTCTAWGVGWAGGGVGRAGGVCGSRGGVPGSHRVRGVLGRGVGGGRGRVPRGVQRGGRTGGVGRT